jgi:hypothetical protein
MSSKHSSSSVPAKPSNTALVESLIGHIDDFQNGTANEQTYLMAMNALRDLHKYVKKTEKAKEVTRKSSVVVLIDGEEFFIEDFETIRIAVRFSDNYAYSSDTGEFLGVWNEQLRTLQDV